MPRVGGLCELRVEKVRVHALDATSVLLQMHVTFSARATGRIRRLPDLELLTVRDGRVARGEAFLSDTAALVALLP